MFLKKTAKTTTTTKNKNKNRTKNKKNLRPLYFLAVGNCSLNSLRINYKLVLLSEGYRSCKLYVIFNGEKKANTGGGEDDNLVTNDYSSRATYSSFVSQNFGFLVYFTVRVHL